MSNPQYTLTIALGVGEEGRKRRDAYEKAADGKALSKWITEVLDQTVLKISGQLYKDIGH